jgi:hypothetical protein
MIDWLIWSKTSYNRPWPTYIYVARYRPFHESENPNQIWWKSLLRFGSDLWKPDSPVSQTGTSDFAPWAFWKCHSFIVRATNHAFHISILIVSMRASSWMLQKFSLTSYSCSWKNFFISWVKFSQIVRERRAEPEKHASIVQLVKYIKLASI